MLSQTVFPPDIRIEKEIKTLSENGYEITIICNQYDKKKSPDFPYCRIERVKALFSSYRLNKIFNFPFFLNPRYVLKVFLTVIRIKPKIIHAHDLPMVPLALMINFFFRLPIIYDMHENYPEALKYFQKKGLINYIFKNHHLVKVLEHLCLKFADRVIVVIEEGRERLIKSGYNPAKVFVVSNTIDYENFISNDTSTEILGYSFDDKPVILYTGTISPDRDLLTAINSVKYFPKFGIDAQMLIIGDGVYRNYLIDYTLKIGLIKSITFMKWPGHSLIPKFIEKAKICMIPQPNNDFINTTIPHKLFEYMYMAKPVIVSDAIPIKRIVQETNSGVYFKSGDAEDFAQKVTLLFNSKINYGANGHNAVLKKYNWNFDSKVLLEMYAGINK